jgi:hypothetical protein
MNKYAAWLCFTASCTLGCRNVALRTEMAPYLSPSAQPVKATSLKPDIAKLTGNATELDPAKQAKEQDAEVEHAPTMGVLKQIRITPNPSQKDKGEVAASVERGSEHTLDHAFCNGIHDVVRAVVDIERMAADSAVATLLAAAVLVKEVKETGPLAQRLRGKPDSDHAPYPDLSKKVWYCIAWTGGAIFTCILAPLIVDLIKLRTGFGRPSADSYRFFERDEADTGRLAQGQRQVKQDVDKNRV